MDKKAASRMNLRKKRTQRFAEKEWETKATKRKITESKSREPAKKKTREMAQTDKYCWICHKRKVSGGRCCSQCPRFYHTKCLKSQDFNEMNCCPDCQLTSLTGETSVSFERIRELLMYAVDRTFGEERTTKDFLLKWPENEANSKLFRIVDKQYFCQGLIKDSYRTHIKFWIDFKWIYHNSCIVYGDKSPNAVAAEQLIKKMHVELSSLEACTDCYYYRNSIRVDEATFFSRPCSNPHEVIMAKVKWFPYWPAKCLKVTKRGNAVAVFFGTHDVACVPANMWFPLKVQPESSQQQKQYCTAMDELFKYKLNLKEPLVSKKKVRTAAGVEKLEKETQTFQSEIPESVSPIFHNELVPEVMDISDDCGKYKSNVNEIPINQNNFLLPRISAYGSASVSMTFCQEDDSDKSSIYDSAPEDKPNAQSNEFSYSNQNVINDSVFLQFPSKSPNNRLSSKSKYRDGDGFAANSKIDSQKDLPVMNLDTAALAELITSRDPQFPAIFKEKSKELFDSMMIHSWAKSQMSTSSVPNFLEEPKLIEPQILKKNERQLKNRLSNKEVLLFEMGEKLKKIKTENIEITDKYNKLVSSS